MSELTRTFAAVLESDSLTECMKAYASACARCTRTTVRSKQGLVTLETSRGLSFIDFVVAAEEADDALEALLVRYAKFPSPALEDEIRQAVRTTIDLRAPWTESRND